MNLLLLHLLLPTLLRNLLGQRITRIGWIEPILSLGFSDKRESHIIAILGYPGLFCFIAPDDPLAGCSARPVLQEATETKLTNLSIPETDRTLSFGLSGRDGELTLSLLLFGGSGRVILSRGKHVVGSIGGSARRFFPGAKTRKAQRSLVNITEKELMALLETEPTFMDRVPGLEPEFFDAFSLPSKKLDAAGLIHFRDEILNGTCPFFLAARDRLADAFPLPATPSTAKKTYTIFGPFSNGSEACRHLGAQLTHLAFGHIINRATKSIRKRSASRKALRARLQTELKEAEQHLKLRRETEALAAYQTRVPPGAPRIDLPDPRDPGKMKTIELDPALSIQEQIQKRFRKASKLERSTKRITGRIREVEKEIASLEEVLAAADKPRSFPEALQQLEKAIIATGLPSGAAGSITKKTEKRAYRRYDIDPQWFALVGRNNRENDEITFRVARPDDWWFHAQDVPGSHVILKSKRTGENPPTRVLIAAAGIAAFYSKSRHASLVPVIYTRRKYVRKPRKAAPGKVFCEREKTLFAEPALPATS